MLKETVIAILKEKFGEGVRLEPFFKVFATFDVKHDSVGEVVIEEDGNELIVSIGDITHGHFGSYESGLSDKEHETS